MYYWYLRWNNNNWQRVMTSRRSHAHVHVTLRVRTWYALAASRRWLEQSRSSDNSSITQQHLKYAAASLRRLVTSIISITSMYARRGGDVMTVRFRLQFWGHFCPWLWCTLLWQRDVVTPLHLATMNMVWKAAVIISKQLFKSCLIQTVIDACARSRKQCWQYLKCHLPVLWRGLRFYY